ncbi:hypothetical protein EDD16DRAFT_1532387 [Pisolithus croceorrhizus]|nr:hypothetical protein EDD16DRAFT_1532387 [Pisolithus croceorrhizus]KAI6168811.1 hypothetical protein EDD17DRAFT_1530426 [Pisolithus thermaeus]
MYRFGACTRSSIRFLLSLRYLSLFFSCACVMPLRMYTQSRTPIHVLSSAALSVLFICAEFPVTNHHSYRLDRRWLSMFYHSISSRRPDAQVH